MLELSILIVGILIGFGSGYGVREIVSQRRRAEERARRHGDVRRPSQLRGFIIITALCLLGAFVVAWKYSGKIPHEGGLDISSSNRR